MAVYRCTFLLYDMTKWKEVFQFVFCKCCELPHQVCMCISPLLLLLSISKNVIWNSFQKHSFKIGINCWIIIQSKNILKCTAFKWTSQNFSLTKVHRKKERSTINQNTANLNYSLFHFPFTSIFKSKSLHTFSCLWFSCFDVFIYILSMTLQSIYYIGTIY